MKIKSFHKILTASLALMMLASCSDFFDINEDPNNPTVAQPDLLLTNAQAAIAGAIGMGNGINQQISVFMHQMVRRGDGDQYVTQGDQFAIGTSWQTFYDIALPDLEGIINEQTVAGNMQYVGIAKLLKAYSYSVMVDLWGDVPFSQATDIDAYRFPAHDSDSSIYNSLFALIDEGAADLQNEEAANVLTPGADDLIYGGSASLWLKFAATLKFKLLYQLQDDDNLVPNRDAMLAGLVANPDTLINDADEDFELWYGSSGPSPENRHGLFVSEYTQANPGFYVSPWLYETMQGQNTEVLNNITDPRIPYYWHRQLTADEDPENPFEYLTDDGFLTIHFGSIHPNQASGQQSSQTVFGLYPAGGYYDDDSGKKVSASTGDGVAPERMLNYFKVLYMRAELALAGITAEDDSTMFAQAIDASFAEVNEIVGITSQADVPEITDAQITTYIDAVMNRYQAGTDEEKLELILTEKWLANLGNAIDAYTDYRREGYPVLFDPNNYNGNYEGGNPQNFSALTTAGRDFPVSLPWYQRDLSINPNSPAQKNPTTDKIFWDKD